LRSVLNDVVCITGNDVLLLTVTGNDVIREMARDFCHVLFTALIWREDGTLKGGVE